MFKSSFIPVLELPFVLKETISYERRDASKRDEAPKVDTT